MAHKCCGQECAGVRLRGCCAAFARLWGGGGGGSNFFGGREGGRGVLRGNFGQLRALGPGTGGVPPAVGRSPRALHVCSMRAAAPPRGPQVPVPVPGRGGPGGAVPAALPASFQPSPGPGPGLPSGAPGRAAAGGMSGGVPAAGSALPRSSEGGQQVGVGAGVWGGPGMRWVPAGDPWVPAGTRWVPAGARPREPPAGSRTCFEALLARCLSRVTKKTTGR